MLVDTARHDLVWRSRRGIGNVVAPLLVWAGLSLLVLLSQDPGDSQVIYLVASLLLWPLNLLLGRLLSRRSSTADNPLFRLALIGSFLSVIFIPVIVGTYLTAPNMMPLYLCILTGGQFLLYIWIYESFAYLFGSLGVVEVAVLISWLAPKATYWVTPVAITIILSITTVFLLGEISKDTEATRHV